MVKKLTAEGYAIDPCTNGLDAYDFLESAPILDIIMQKLDGLEVVKRLRGKGNLKPILFLTARDTVADRVKGLDMGANDYGTADGNPTDLKGVYPFSKANHERIPLRNCFVHGGKYDGGSSGDLRNDE